jgi:hypothetical protein
MKTLVMALVICGAVGAGIQAMPKYGVKVTVDKKTDFTRLKTYVWFKGWTAFSRDIDRAIVAAVDRELAAAGLTQVAALPSDVVVTYASLSRTDVNLKAKRLADGTYPEYPVGTLVVMLLEPQSRRELFRTRIDMPIETEPSKLERQVDIAVTEMFRKYPTKRR